MYDQFHLVLTVNHACNLRCTYCYTGSKFSRKMPREIGCRAIDRAVASIRDGGTLELGFFGGEPLIEAGLIDLLLDHAERAAASRGIRVIPGLTTNGTMTGELAWSIMTRPGLELAISHDGLPQVHDRHRLTIPGGGTSDVVEATLRRLIDMPKDFTVVMVVRPDTVDHLAAGIAYLRSLGVRRVEPSIDLWTFWCQRDIQRLERQIERCAILWREGLPARSIGWFDEKVPGLLGMSCGSSARCGFGAGEIAVAPSGRLYPCERLIGEDASDNPSVLPGHALEGRDFLDSSAAPARSHPECNECPIQQLCNTTCRCSNVVRTGDPQQPDELLCVWNQACLTATADALAKLSPTELLADHQGGLMSDEVHPEPANPPVIDYSNGRRPGQPRRWRFKPVWPVVLTGAIAGGGTLLVLIPSVNSCRGATRSTKLQWVERSAEIDQATLSQSEADQ